MLPLTITFRKCSLLHHLSITGEKPTIRLSHRRYYSIILYFIKANSRQIFCLLFFYFLYFSSLYIFYYIFIYVFIHVTFCGSKSNPKPFAPAKNKRQMYQISWHLQRLWNSFAAQTQTVLGKCCKCLNYGLPIF